MNRLALCVALTITLGGCSTRSELPTGQAAYQAVPVEAPPVGEQDYLIGPLDRITVTVFREPDLSVQDVPVDAAGKLALPLLGTISVNGKSAETVAAELRQDLRVYLKNPKVSVLVNSITQKVVVEGQVNQPGVFDIRGNSSLVEALAMARSPTDLADLDQVYVFRKVGGRMQGARFNLRRIRTGLDPDPAIIAGDRIVVGLDSVASAWREYVSRPIFNVFRFF